MQKSNKQNVFKTQIASFKYALEGLVLLFGKERNAKIHLIAAALVVAFGFLLEISMLEWCMVILCISLVTALEGLNTALEHLSNTVTKEYHPNIKKVKDIAAGAVFIAALGALAVGLIIFLPKLISTLLH